MVITILIFDRRNPSDITRNGGSGGMVQNSFSGFRFFFDSQFKNTFHLILSFKLHSERFFHKVFKTGLTF